MRAYWKGTIMEKSSLHVRNITRRSFMALATGAIVTTLALAGCGSSESIVGTWANAEGDEVLQFESNGTCSVPFTYSAGWMESCDRYVMRDDGTLVLSSSQGNIGSREYEQTASPEEAEESSAYYYLSGNDLIIDRTSYSRE